MRKNIALLALEGEEVVEDSSTSMEEGIANLEVEENKVNDIDNQMEEASEISESVGKLEENIRLANDEKEGIDPIAAEAIRIAIEHFCKRVGYEKLVMPAMEGFNHTATRLNESQQTLQNLAEFKHKLDTGLSIAQEGMFENIKTNIDMLFENEVKVLARLNAASKNFDNSEVRVDPIYQPSWGKYLNSDNGAGAIALLTEIDKTIHNANLREEVNALGTSLVKLTKEVRGNWFYSNKSDIERIERIGEDVDRAGQTILNDLENSSAKEIVEFKPLSKQEKDKLVKLVQAVLNDDKLSSLISSFYKKSGALSLWTLWQSNFRIKGLAGSVVGGWAGGAVAGTAGATIGGKLGSTVGFLTAEDIQKANKIHWKAYRIIKVINQIIGKKLKICSAIVSYIEASTKG